MFDLGIVYSKACLEAMQVTVSNVIHFMHGVGYWHKSSDKVVLPFNLLRY